MRCVVAARSTRCGLRLRARLLELKCASKNFRRILLRQPVYVWQSWFVMLRPLFISGKIKGHWQVMEKPIFLGLHYSNSCLLERLLILRAAEQFDLTDVASSPRPRAGLIAAWRFSIGIPSSVSEKLPLLAARSLESKLEWRPWLPNRGQAPWGGAFGCLPALRNAIRLSRAGASTN